MGTLVITEHQSVGGPDNPDDPVLGPAIAVGVSSTSTSTTPAQVTSGGGARILRVHSVDGNHRVKVNTSAAADVNTGPYDFIPSGQTVDIPIRGGKSYSYRLDA